MKVFEKNCNNISGASLLGVAVLLFGFFAFASPTHAYTLVEWDSLTTQGTGTHPLSGNYQTGIASSLANIIGYINTGGADYLLAICRQGSSGPGSPINLNNELESTYVDVTFGVPCEDFQNSLVYWFAREGGDIIVARGSYNDNNWTAYEDIPQVGSATSSFSYGFQSTYNTRFLDLDISGTSTVEVDTSYFIDPAEVDTSDPFYNPTLIRYSYALRPSTSVSVSGFTLLDTIGTSSLQSSLGSLADGTYDLLVQFGNSGTSFSGIVPFSDAYIYTDFTVSGGQLSATGTNEFYDSTVFVEPESYKYKQCSITQIGNCITNSFAFLFVPSPSVLNGFTEINSQLSSKFPFAYLYDFVDTITLVFTTEQNQNAEITYAFASYGDMTIISEDMLTTSYAGTVSTIIFNLMTYAIWIMFALHMYKRILKIFNPEPV